MLKVNLLDRALGVEEKTKVIDLIKSMANEDGDIKIENIIACKVNNEIKDLNHEIDMDSDISFIYINSSEGMRIYTRGLSLILLKAFDDLFPQAKVTINYSLGEAFCCEIEGIDIVDEMVVAIRERMHEIVEANLDIEMKYIERTKLKKMYKEEGYIEKVDILNRNLSTYAVLYYLEDTYGYFYGKMPISTEYMKTFDVKKYEKGVILMYPNKNDITVIKASHMNKRLYSTLKEYEEFYKTLGIRNISELNNIIKTGKISEIIRISEAMQEKKISKIADIITREQKRIVLIAGPSSSGKTTFAQRLGIQLKVNHISPITISVDNYFLEREQTPLDENGKYDFECLEAIDLELLNDQVTKILAGEEVEVPEFDFKEGKKKYNGKKIKMEENQILILEGIHCLNDRLTLKIPIEQKYKIFVSAMTVLNIDGYNRISTTDTRLIRRIIRDNKFRNYTITQTLSIWESVRRGEDKYIFPYQENADVMFNSSLPYEFSMFRTFIEPLLLTVEEDSIYYTEAIRLYNLLGLFLPMETAEIPVNSILREFTGNGCFYR